MTTDDLYDYAEAQGISVNSFRLPVSSLSITDLSGACHIALNRNMQRHPQKEKLCLAHELGHCETGAFYPLNSDSCERSRLEYRADKWTVAQLVPWRDYRAAILAGCFEDWEQAEYWDVPVEYVPVIHKVYERTRWGDVQALKQIINTL